jgi:chromosome segregation ATPase
MTADRERIPQRQLGELMTELGLISEEQLATVLEVQQQSKRPLGQIIVELGFASGAAVAHALAMQSGGALKTEYGFALGVSPDDGEADAENEETRAGDGLPRLRLAANAVAPPVRAPVEEPETADLAEPEPEPEPEPAEEPAELVTPSEPEPVAETDEVAEVEEIEEIEELEEAAEAEEPEVSLDEIATTTETPEDTPQTVAPVELDQLRAEAERLEAALAEVRASAAAEQEQLRAEIARLEGVRTETDAEREQELATLREAHENTTAQLARLQATLVETDTEREQATAELARLQTVLAEAENGREELVRLREEHGAAAAEVERVETALAEEQARHAVERDELSRHGDQLQQQLGDTLDRLAAVAPAVEERDELRGTVERLEATLTEVQAAAGADRDRLLSDIDRLERAVAEAENAREQELETVRDAHRQTRDQLERVQTALAEAQTSAIEHERRLADEQDRHTTEREELAGQRDRLQQELGETLEQLAVLGSAAEERDGLRAQVERLESTLAEAKTTFETELLGVGEERDTLTAELDEARKLLVQAERVRESQIALEAERDRLRSELERVRSVAAEAQAEAEEQNRVLAEEQDRHQAERESLLAQRTLLEQELGNAIEQLAAAGTAADEREARLRKSSQQLVDALDAVRRLAAALVADGDADGLPEELEPAATPEGPVAETETDEPEDVADSVEVEYSLFVPGPNGYELVPQTGVPPRAGDKVELVLPNGEEPVVYEVARSGRMLPDGDICVYLAQV